MTKRKNVKKQIIASLMAIVMVVGSTAPAYASDFDTFMKNVPNFNTIVEESANGANIVDVLDKVAQGQMDALPNITEDDVIRISGEFEDKAGQLAGALDESLGLLLEAEENDDNRSAEEICAGPFERIATLLTDLVNLLTDGMNLLFGSKQI